MTTTAHSAGNAAPTYIPAHYSMTISWSERDQAFLVIFPEWHDRLIGQAATHGATYEEAAHNGQIILEMLIADALEDGEPLPPPNVLPLAESE